MSESRVRETRMHGLIGGRWPDGQPDETHEKPKGQRAVPPGTPNNQRPTSPFCALYGDAIQPGNGNGEDAMPMWLKRLVESILLGPAPLPAFFQRSPRSAFFFNYSCPLSDHDF